MDEPASNLHSSAQAKILDAISGLSDKAMVIYSTHSHHLIKIEWLSGAYVIINDNLSDKALKGDISFDETAKITAKKYFNYVGEGLGSDKVSYFQPILDALDYKPSSVEPIPNITILEGKYDWYTFKYFSKILLDDDNKYNLYPGAGRDKLWDIIRLYLSWGKDFIIILDGDRAGVASKEKYLKEFGNFLNNKVFTLKDIVGLEASTEGLIDDNDQRLIYEAVYGKGTYNKIKNNPTKLKENLNYAINQLVFEQNYLPISDATKERFEKIFEFIMNKSFSEKIVETSNAIREKVKV